MYAVANGYRRDDTKAELDQSQLEEPEVAPKLLWHTIGSHNAMVLHRMLGRAPLAALPPITTSPLRRLWAPAGRAGPRTPPLSATITSAAAGPLAPASRAAFKAAVRGGQPLLGLFLNSASPLAAEQLAQLDYDYLLVSWGQGLARAGCSAAWGLARLSHASSSCPASAPRLALPPAPVCHASKNEQVDIQHAPTDYQNLAAMITAVNAGGKPVGGLGGRSAAGAAARHLRLPPRRHWRRTPSGMIPFAAAAVCARRRW